MWTQFVLQPVFLSECGFTPYDILGLPLNKCGFTPYDILAFFWTSLLSLLTFHSVNYNPEP